MKRFLLFLALLFAPALAWGQQTTVTATVTDPRGVPYAFGTGYASLVCPGNQAPTYNGFTVPRTFTIGTFSGTGTFTQVVYDVNAIQPTGCGYQWHINSQSGTISFITTTITSVTGASVNESASISASAVPLASGIVHNFITVIFTSAQLKSLNSTNLTVIPATGVHTYIAIENISWQYKFGTIAYTLGNADNSVDLFYPSGVGDVTGAAAAGMFDQTRNITYYQTWTQAEDLQSSMENQPILMNIQGTTPALTLGDGTLVLMIDYAVIPLL